MSLNEVFDLNSTWATCPTDILLIVFKNLDMKSILNCMDVNVYWRNMVDYYCEHNNLWPQLLKDTIDNEGVTIKEKTMLQCRDQFLNAQKWLDIKNVSVSFQRQYKFEYIRNICVHKDNLIVVSDLNVKYFNTENFELIKTSNKPCLNFEETISFTLELTLPRCALTEFNVMTLTNKLNKHVSNAEQLSKIILYDVNLYKIHLNNCFILDMNNVLWVYEATNVCWVSKVLAKYYGHQNSINSIHIHKQNVYILLKRGDVLIVDRKCKKFEKLFRFDFPNRSLSLKMFMFHNCSVVFKVPKEEIKKISYIQSEKVTMSCPGVTYVLEHGHSLILGYENGKIEIYLIKNLLENKTTPELQFYLQTYLETPSRSIRITSIDVYEENAAHRLFVTTMTSVYELLLCH